MAPGLTSAGGRLPGGGVVSSSPDDAEPAAGAAGAEGPSEGNRSYGGRELEEGEVVVVEAEGKEEACLVGQLKVGTKEIKEKKKGVVMDQGHYLGDGLWRVVID